MVAVVANVLPAWRANGVDPMEWRRSGRSSYGWSCRAGPYSTLPGRAAVIAFPSKTTCPLTTISENPSAYWCGFSSTSDVR